MNRQPEAIVTSGAEMAEKINSVLDEGNIVIIAPEGMTTTDALMDVAKALHGTKDGRRVILFAAPDPEAYGEQIH